MYGVLLCSWCKIRFACASPNKKGKKKKKKSLSVVVVVGKIDEESS